jgi:hypothetical protein
VIRYGYGARYGAVAGLGGQRRNAARLSPRGGLRGTRWEGFCFCVCRDAGLFWVCVAGAHAVGQDCCSGERGPPGPPRSKVPRTDCCSGPQAHKDTVQCDVLRAR